MDIVVGRGGNQAADLLMAEVAPAHCFICRDEDDPDNYLVIPLSILPTLVNGECVWQPGWESFSPDSKITIGKCTATLAELARPMDVAEITDWGIASRRLNDTNAAGAFLDITIRAYRDENAENGGADYVFLRANIEACKALRLIEEGKLRAAQQLLYQVGDNLYAGQDGSLRLKGAYASVLVLLGKLYIAAGRNDVAREALDGAGKMFAGGVKCSHEVTAMFNSLKL